MSSERAAFAVLLAVAILASGLVNVPSQSRAAPGSGAGASGAGQLPGSPAVPASNNTGGAPSSGAVVTRYTDATPAATPDYTCTYATIYSNATATVTENVTEDYYSDVSINTRAGDELVVIGLATYLDGSDYPSVADTQGLDWDMIDNVAPETVFGNGPQTPGTEFLGVNVWTAVAAETGTDTIGFHSQYFQTVYAYDIAGTVSATNVGTVAFVSNPNGTTLTRTVTEGGCDLLLATHQTETADYYNGSSAAPSGWVTDQLTALDKSYFTEAFHSTVLTAGTASVSISVPTNNSDFYVAAGLVVGLDATPPTAPQLPVARAVAAGEIGLAWTNPGGYFNDNVTVYRYAAGCTGSPVAYSLAGVPSTVVVGGLVPGDSYGFQVAVWNPLGSSPLSACATATDAPPYYDTISPAASPEFEENTSSMWGATGQFGANAPNVTLTDEVQPTDIRTLRFDPQIDWTNLSAGVSYVAWNGTVGAGPSEVNLPADWAFCESLVPKCEFILQLPAETDSVGDMLSALRYSLSVGVRAYAYTIGNEPENWEHFDIPWAQWKQSDDSPVTPAEYAAEVRTMAAAIRGVVPGARVDIESYGCFPHALLNETIEEDGDVLSAIGCHWYPSGYDDAVLHETSLQDLYNGLWSGGLENTTNPTGVRLNELRAEIAADWPGVNLPVWIDEFGIQYGWSSATGDPANWVVYQRQYADFPYTAGAIAQSMEVNLTQLLYFDLWGQDGGDFSMIGNGVGTGSDAYLEFPVVDLYRYFLPNVTSGAYYPLSFLPLAFPSYAGFIRGWDVGSLLVVNTNATAGEWITASLPAGVNATSGGAVWYWDGTTAAPSVTSYVTVPSTFYVGPQSVLLVDTAIQPPPPSGGNQTGGCPTGTITWTNTPPPYGQSLVNVTVWLYDLTSGGLVGIYSTNGPASSLTVTGLVCGDNYGFQVEDWYSSGESGPISGIIGYFAGNSPGSVLGVFGDLTSPELAILVAGAATVTLVAVGVSLRRGDRTRARRLGK